MSNIDLTRRDALAITGSAAMALLLPGGLSNAGEAPLPVATPARPTTLSIFSRHLHWTGIEEAIDVAASAGFTGIAWTVRSGAHVEPQNVARDLPRAVELTRRAGLSVSHIVTALNDADSPYAESIVATATGLGIRNYRMQTGRYDYSRDVPAQLEALRPRIAGLVRLNERYGATALIHTHGGLVAGAVWDTWLLLRDFDPERIGINFDTAYGTATTGNGWMEAVRFARSHIRFLSLKDFRWREQTQGGPRWVPELCPAGEGVVDFREMFAWFHSVDFRGPAELQFEYPIPVPGSSRPMNLMAHNFGQWQLEIPKADFIALLKRDVDFYSARLQEAGQVPASGLK